MSSKKCDSFIFYEFTISAVQNFIFGTLEYFSTLVRSKIDFLIFENMF
jgi:hypothetical protein